MAVDDVTAPVHEIGLRLGAVRCLRESYNLAFQNGCLSDQFTGWGEGTESAQTRSVWPTQCRPGCGLNGWVPAGPGHGVCDGAGPDGRAGDGLEMQPRRHQRWTSPSLVEFWSRHWDSPANVHTDWTSGGRAAPFFFFASGGSAKGSNGSIGGCVFLKMHVFTFFIFFLFFLDSMPLLTARIAQWNLQRTARTSPGALGWAVSFCSNRGHRSFFLRPGCRLRAQTGQ